MNQSENLGLTDRLTGLKNYECFTSEFEEMVRVSQEKREDLALAMVDIDRFMNINEEHGHGVGDRVIMVVAKHITKNTPENTEIYRYSGDEFAVLLPNTEKESAFLMMEKLRDSFSFDNKEGDVKVNVTLSTGISHLLLY